MKTVEFPESIAACDLKVGRCRQLIEIMKVCEYCLGFLAISRNSGFLVSNPPFSGENTDRLIRNDLMRPNSEGERLVHASYM